MKTTHKKVVIWMYAVSIIVYSTVFFLFFWPNYYNLFSWKHYWSFYCFIFLLGWWFIYYASKELKIWSLRLFLDRHSTFREETQQKKIKKADLKRLEEIIIDKSSSTITAQGIFIVIVSLFLTLVLNAECKSEYEKFLRFLILFTALTTIIFMVFAIDLLNTVSNIFKPGAKTPLGYQVYFYRRLGTLIPKGGISYAYYGYASFSLFFLLSLSFFSPLLAGFGLSFFTYLGYPIFFGYKGKWKKKEIKEIEIDEEIKWAPITLGTFFLLVTGLIWYIG